jgi:uncharacterized membrane protein (UPF0127 family)
MAKLFRDNSKQNNGKQILLSDLKEARSFVARTKGLLGTNDLAIGSGLWIHRCNSIHTFFMRYSLDCIFLDKDMNVCKLVRDVKPGRVVWPIWSADSVIEMKAGSLDQMSIYAGDLLYVGA